MKFECFIYFKLRDANVSTAHSEFWLYLSYIFECLVIFKVFAVHTSGFLINADNWDLYHVDSRVFPWRMTLETKNLEGKAMFARSCLFLVVSAFYLRTKTILRLVLIRFVPCKFHRSENFDESQQKTEKFNYYSHYSISNLIDVHCDHLYKLAN